MDPLSFLVEECGSVESALKETLRHDYGPEQSAPYFDECQNRLQAIRQAISDGGLDRANIAALMQWLSVIGSRISLIERSHLGEFSWPFSGVIRKIATEMFSEQTVDGLKPPIIHVIAEGMDYQIVDDDLSKGGLQRIIIVAFPRQLKHHVLIHTIFGHELGHIAYHLDTTGAIIHRKVMPALRRGILQDVTQAQAWVSSDRAPKAVKALDEGQRDKLFNETVLNNWRQEIFCDLFGLRLFGPVFAAAHRTVIEALCARPDALDVSNSSHPPYPVRQRIVARAIQKWGWDNPISPVADRVVFAAETALIDYITQSTSDPWFEVIDDDQLNDVLGGIDEIFETFPNVAYAPPTADALIALLDRLSLERPPIKQTIDKQGAPLNEAVPAAHCLYAGWVFWFGRETLHEQARQIDPDIRELSFLELNRLCDQALLQQEAIDMILNAAATDAAAAAAEAAIAAAAPVGGEGGIPQEAATDSSVEP